MSGKVTPMLAQYLEIKGRHPDAMLLFRMGDFFETFFDDAEVLARVTGVTLTTRDRNSDHPVPLAGVPHHALDTYLSRLLAAGLTVAICEQVEDPAQARGLVKREVVEILSPGTATAPELIQDAAGVYCLAYLPGDMGIAGWALLDASTGDFRCGQEAASLSDLCERHSVREVIVREDCEGELLNTWRNAKPDIVFNPVSAAWFHPAFAGQTLQEHFQVKQLSAFGLESSERELALAAAGALLRYLTSLNLKRPPQITSLRYCACGDRLLLDEETLRNLEVFRTFSGDRGAGTLIHHIDRTRTAMGRRLLAQRLASPLTELELLNRWHDGVASAVTAREWRRDLRTILGGLGDLERWSARAARGSIGPAQLGQLGRSLRVVSELLARVQAEPDICPPVTGWAIEAPDLSPLASRIIDTLPDDPPALTRSGGYIRIGIHKELDGCRTIATDTKGYLARLQAEERERSGIPTLKVGYNKVFGYFFEVTKKHLDKVPADYSQRQTLVNASRFQTDALKVAEQKILEAESRAQELERDLYEALLAEVAQTIREIHVTARLVAAIDLMLAFAEIAEERDFCRPLCDDSTELEIIGGRHPVVEELLAGDFIPNDTSLDGEQRQIILLTGPNMGGKSTYLRQVALICLLAQTGSFVPAASARIGLADRIFTRVGASDNLARGQSTFFSEMTETAHILHQMSRRSLVILDEVGRGTSTYDGLSLAWAITEYLQSSLGPRPRSIFATHYHELTELEQSLDGLINLRMDVKEWEGKIIFLHAVRPGCSDQSYGIHVARLAGIPEPVLRRAQRILEGLTLEDKRTISGGFFRAGPGGASLVADGSGAGSPQQLSLFQDAERDALESLKELDLENISPVDAFMWLMKIKKQLPG
ncbi:MAG: DNA mismatch repair protein MutS [bacterium]